ncbi:hypothetical protein MAUB1S_04537 [Mycolicibacterium aubagnense]
MTQRVIDKLGDIADQLREQAWEAEKLGQLPDETVKLMKAAGNIKLLQPTEYDGLEVHPREFAETVMATAALDPAAGWINGVVGVHPYQLAYADPKVAAEISGIRHRHLGRLSVRSAGRGPARRRRLHLQRPLAVQLGHRPLRVNLPGRHAR